MPPQEDNLGITTLSEAGQRIIESIADENNEDNVIPELADQPPLDEEASGNDTLNATTSPAVQGEQAVNASTPDPDSDDDMLQNAQNMGFQLEEDEEHPKPLDMGSDIDKAEEYHRTH